MMTRPFDCGPSPLRSFSCASVNAVIPCARVGLMESQLAIIFERVLRLDQRARRHFEPVDQAGEQETQRGAAAQYRKRRNLARGQLARPHVTVSQRAPLGHVVGMVLLEAPSV